jgi:hypothetical protein
MQTRIFAAAYAGLLIFGVFQVAAALCGLQQLTGLWWFTCVVAALVVGWTPIAGTALGICGAHLDWGWGLPESVALFVGTPCLLLCALTVSLSSAWPGGGHRAKLTHGELAPVQPSAED